LVEEMTIDGPGQHKALAHPMRHRLLFAIGQEPATISQLAAALGANKGSVAHHLKVLADAGLVTVDRTRQVRGGTEIYYRRAAERIRYPVGDATAASFAAVAEEIVTHDPDPLVIHRHVRLTAPQVAQLRETIESLAQDIAEAGEGEQRYGVLLGLYRAESSAGEETALPGS